MPATLEDAREAPARLALAANAGLLVFCAFDCAPDTANFGWVNHVANACRSCRAFQAINSEALRNRRRGTANVGRSLVVSSSASSSVSATAVPLSEQNRDRWILATNTFSEVTTSSFRYKDRHETGPSKTLSEIAKYTFQYLSVPMRAKGSISVMAWADRKLKRTVWTVIQSNVRPTA